MGTDGITNPLTVDDLLTVQSVYRSLHDEDTFVKSLPRKTDWIRWRYHDDHIMTKLGSTTFSDPPTISINRAAFRWGNPTLLKGLIRHELLHLVFGADEGHGVLFTTAEESWPLFPLYRRQVRHFFTAVHTSNGEHTYICPECQGIKHLKRRLRPNAACLDCCKAFNGGKWCETYVLIKVGDIP